MATICDICAVASKNPGELKKLSVRLGNGSSSLGIAKDFDICEACRKTAQIEVQIGQVVLKAGLQGGQVFH